jgi:hypothetical protein
MASFEETVDEESDWNTEIFQLACDTVMALFCFNARFQFEDHNQSQNPNMAAPNDQLAATLAALTGVLFSCRGIRFEASRCPP